ncbi:MAG TPA: sodium:alanine symporter family protein [Pseudomonadales bacterium]
MELIMQWVGELNGLVWGVPMLVLILGTGLYLTIGLKAFPMRHVPKAFVLLVKKPTVNEKGDISSFQALMTSLAATIGTGNIAGVATAIALGGPGALFWMWMTAVVGMATKYAETVLAIQYREQDEAGNYCGGPMYYIRNGLGKNWRWLAAAFALFGMLAGFGIGNTVQANSVAHALNEAYGIDAYFNAVSVPFFEMNVGFVGIVMLVLTAAVVLGGIRWIGAVAGKLVPFMALAYMAAGLLVLALNIERVPGIFSMVFEHAFTGTAAQGGFAGATVWLALQWGVARGIFSNEAGLGSAPIAHAAAKTDDAVSQGLIGMLGTFIDTLVVCSVTGLVILLSGLWSGDASGSALSAQAFDAGVPGLGKHVVALGISLFAFTTILGWCYYGERCTEYLFGLKAVLPFRVLWVIAVPVGTVMELNEVWLIADTLNALMAIPNIIALLLLSPVVFALTRARMNKKEV